MALSDDLFFWYSATRTYAGADADCLADLSGNGYDADSYEDGATTVADTDGPGNGSRAFDFPDTTDPRVDLATAAAALAASNTGCAVSFWFKPTDPTLGGNLFSLLGLYSTVYPGVALLVSVPANSQCLFAGFGTDVSGEFWQHLFIRYKSGSHHKVYLDGVEQQHTDLGAQLEDGDLQWWHHRIGETVMRFFGNSKIRVDDFLVWTADKSEADLAELYAGGRGYDILGGGSSTRRQRTAQHYLGVC